MTSSDPHRPARGPSRALVVIPLAMAAALVATVIVTERDVAAVHDAVARGQGESLIREVRRTLRAGGGEDSLSLLVGPESDSGLRCLVVFGPGRQPETTLGDCPDDATALLAAMSPGEMVEVGERLRMVAHPPPEERPAPGGRRDGKRRAPPRARQAEPTRDPISTSEQPTEDEPARPERPPPRSRRRRGPSDEPPPRPDAPPPADRSTTTRPPPPTAPPTAHQPPAPRGGAAGPGDRGGRDRSGAAPPPPPSTEGGGAVPAQPAGSAEAPPPRDGGNAGNPPRQLERGGRDRGRPPGGRAGGPPRGSGGGRPPGGGGRPRGVRQAPAATAEDTPDAARRRPRRPPAGRRLGDLPPALGRGRNRREVPLLIEFVPTQSRDIELATRRNLMVGGAASLLLLITAVLVWRNAVRADRERGRLERDRRLAALGEMSAVMAHEIRNPLASMKGHAQLLAEQLQDRPREKAQRVVQEIVRLERLTGDLLSFVRSQKIERRAIDPRALLRDAADSAVEVEVELETEGAPSRWSLDRDRIHQVLVNLLRNAVQASPEGSRVTASVELRERALVYAVRDRGEGIPSGQEDSIFEAFQTGRTRGTGLGLAVARRIVELHGGTITARNHPDGGAVFRVTIPRG